MKTLHIICFFLISCIGIHAQSAKSFYKAARKSEKEQNYTAALDNYTKALELKPGNYKYTVGKANSYRILNDKTKALAVYEDAFKIKNSEKWLYTRIAEIAIDLGEYRKACNYSEQLIAKDKKNTDAYRKTAWCYIKLKEFNKALDICNKVLDLEKYYHTNHYYKALALDSMKKYTEANMDYVMAIKNLNSVELDENKKVKPQFKSYFYDQAICLNQLKDYTNAIKYFNTALDIDGKDVYEPKNYLVYFKRSQSYLGKEDYLNPLGDLNKCLVLNNEFVDGFLLRADVYKKTSQFQSAINDYTKVTLLNEKYALAYKRRAECYTELASNAEAIIDYTKYVRLNPEDKEAKTQLDIVTKKLYEANRENDNPDVRILYPVVDGSGYVNVFTSQSTIVVEGTVKDKSFISSISLNGVQAQYKNTEKNPDFICSVPVSTVRAVELVVKDVYLNTTTKTIKLGKILDYNKVQVRFAGQIVSDDDNKKPLSGKKVNLTNEKGEIFYSTFTDNNGKFVFEKLPYDKNYLLAFDVEDNTQLSGIKSFVVLNEKGQPIIKSKSDTKGSFSFQILQNDPASMSLMTIDDSPLMIDMKGKVLGDDQAKSPLANITVLLINEKGEIVATKKTDANGLFIFRNLLPGQSYMIGIDEADSKNITYNRIIITNENSQVVKEISRDQFGKFVFRMLPAESIQLTSISEEIADPWISAIKLNVNKKEISIIENIYYASGAFAIPKDAEPILIKAITALTENPKLNLEVQAHTDALAGDDFNMELSQKRANAVIDYLVKLGVNKKRLKAIGLGESQLINQCANGVECSDAEHKQNRRTVFKLNYEGAK
ncbi:MAG: OmpA family protein [Bacteroidota bacterium]|nr:OmpA family protein [Bacteroidota bacterium]